MRATTIRQDFLGIAAAVAMVMLGMASALAGQAPAAKGRDRITLEICRLPGTEAEYSGQPIRVPAGTRFIADSLTQDFALGGATASGAAPGVITAAAVSIPADGFCAYAKVRPAPGSDAAVLRANLGRMFVTDTNVATSLHARLTIDDVDMVYGLLEAGKG